MEAKAEARYIRISPQKARLVVDLIRGQQVELLVPMTYQRKQLPFIVDVTKSPMTFITVPPST